MMPGSLKPADSSAMPVRTNTTAAKNGTAGESSRDRYGMSTVKNTTPTAMFRNQLSAREFSGQTDELIVEVMLPQNCLKFDVSMTDRHEYNCNEPAHAYAFEVMARPEQKK